MPRTDQTQGDAMLRRLLLPSLLVVAGLLLGAAALLDPAGDDIGAVEAPASTPPSTTASPTSTPSSEPSRVRPAPPAPTPAPAPTPTASPSPTATTAPPEVARRSGRVGDRVAASAAPPVRLRIGSVEVAAPVAPVGVDDEGRMGVPEDVATVGWYRFGPTPSAASGSVVLAGHVDDREQGRGAFFALRDVRLGDEVEVRDAGGATTTWEVVGRRTYDKASLPVEQLYGRSGGPRLVLITCGGDFDAGARSYRSNVVVVAEPTARGSA